MYILLYRCIYENTMYMSLLFEQSVNDASNQVLVDCTLSVGPTSFRSACVASAVGITWASYVH